MIAEDNVSPILSQSLKSKEKSKISKLFNKVVVMNHLVKMNQYQLHLNQQHLIQQLPQKSILKNKKNIPKMLL
jgi:hypothetical protein